MLVVKESQVTSMMLNQRAVASPVLSVQVEPELPPDESVLEWTLGRISLPPSSPQMSNFSDIGEEMRLDELGATSLRRSSGTLDAKQSQHAIALTKKQEDEAERERLEALKAHIPACLSNVLAIAPAQVTGVCQLQYCKPLAMQAAGSRLPVFVVAPLL